MNGRIIWLDNVRAVACVLVVVLHTVTLYAIAFDKNGVQWNIANIIDSFSRICVPLFFMISGFIFMQNKEIKTKNILKVLANLILYTLIAAIYLVVFKSKSLESVLSPGLFFNSFEKPLFYHLWFFYKLLICYFIFSLISIKSISSIKFLLIALVIFIVFNPTTSNFTSQFFGISYGGILTINDPLIFYILYGAFGASIGTMDIKPNRAYLYLSLFILFSLLTAVFTYSISAANGRYNSSYYSYTALFVMLSSVFLFSFIKSKGNEFNVFGPATKYIATASLPIYGIHAFILEWLLDAHIDQYISPFGFPIIFIIVFVPSLAFGLLLAKVDRKHIFS